MACCARLPPCATLPHYLVYRDTLAPKNTLANLTTALLETKAVQAYVVAGSSSQTIQEQYLRAFLLVRCAYRSQLYTLSLRVTAIILALYETCDTELLPTW